MKPESVLSENDYKRVFDSLIANPDREAFLRGCIDEYLPANPRFFALLELVCRERLSPELESVNQFSIANPNVPIDELKSVRHKDLESVLRLIVATDQQMRYGAIYDRLTAIVREHLPNYPTGHNWSWLNELEPYLGRCKQWSDLLSMYTDQPEIINAKIDKWLEPLLDTQAEAWEEYKRAALINDQPSKIKEIEAGKWVGGNEPELKRRSFQMADFQLQVYRDFLEALRSVQTEQSGQYSTPELEPESHGLDKLRTGQERVLEYYYEGGFESHEIGKAAAKRLGVEYGYFRTLKSSITNDPIKLPWVDLELLELIRDRIAKKGLTLQAIDNDIVRLKK